MDGTQELDGLSPLVASTVRLNESYNSLMLGGFNSDEALTLIAKMTKPTH
jgi:hypothetical protein